MRRNDLFILWVLAIGLMLAAWMTAVSQAQITAASSVQTKTATASPKEFTAENVTGVPMSAACCQADPDTIKAAWLEATVDSVLDSTRVRLDVAMSYGTISLNRRLTVRTDLELWLPPVSWSGIPDSLFSLVLNDTLRHQAGWKFKLRVRETDSKLLPMTATVLSGARVRSAVDTVTGSAVRADYGRLSLELTATAAHADSCQVRVLGQVRLRNGTWAGEPDGKLIVLADSLVLTPGVTRKLPLNLPDTEWFRPVVTGNSRTGNVTLTLNASLN